MRDIFFVSADRTVKLELLVTDLSGKKPVEPQPKLLTEAEVTLVRRVLD